jgi:hypothetical protein
MNERTEWPMNEPQLPGPGATESEWGGYYYGLARLRHDEIQRLRNELAEARKGEAFADRVAIRWQAEAARLDALVNSPETADFIDGVRREAAHQRERWGAPHDREKSAEHWYWLVGYLAGKALRAAIEGKVDKALHHTISSAAALSHWHRAICEDTTGAGVGRDADLKAHDEPPSANWVEWFCGCGAQLPSRDAICPECKPGPDIKKQAR